MYFIDWWTIEIATKNALMTKLQESSLKIGNVFEISTTIPFAW